MSVSQYQKKSPWKIEPQIVVFFYAVNCTHARTHARTHTTHANARTCQRTSNERQGRRYEEIRNANMWNENMGATTGQQLVEKACSGEETSEKLIYYGTHLFWAFASCRFSAYSAHTLWESMNSLSHGWMYLLCSQNKQYYYRVAFHRMAWV